MCSDRLRKTLSLSQLEAGRLLHGFIAYAGSVLTSTTSSAAGFLCDFVRLLCGVALVLLFRYFLLALVFVFAAGPASVDYTGQKIQVIDFKA